jgi:spore coat polysaccharide biosynthesis protein SpsF (cytidylyltransferase family)
VDNEADFQLVTKVYENLYRNDKPFLMEDVLYYLSQHPEVADMNRAFIGLEGYRALWNKGDKS